MFWTRAGPALRHARSYPACHVWQMPPYSVYTRPCSGTVYSADHVARKKQGRLAGDMAIRVLNGENPASIPSCKSEKCTSTCSIGGNSVAGRFRKAGSRWGAPCATREPSLWDLYRYYILGGIALVIVQSLLIVVLLINRRRRRRTEAELAENLRFEKVLSALSSRFLAPPDDGIDQIVAQSLREIAGVLRFQRAALFEFSRTEGKNCSRPPMGGRRNRAADRCGWRSVSFPGFSPT